MPESSDSDFTWESFFDSNNNELVATFGNLVNRIQSLIKNIICNTKSSLETHNSKLVNNLTQHQRKSLIGLTKDTSIIIKPSDKSGCVVVMGIEDYEEACLSQLNDKTFYEELPADPNVDYKKNLIKEVEVLKSSKLISENEQAKLLEGNSTPSFYGMPKLHSTKPDNKFPPLRGICSGSNSCTKRLSELIDTFLKPAARKLPSYVQDTTSFINRIRSFKPTKHHQMYY